MSSTLSPIDFESSRQWAESIVSRLTLDEKILLIGGKDAFFTHPVERLGLTSVFFSDASQGVHLLEEFKGIRYEKRLERSTQFPCMAMLAATWNRQLAMAYAGAIGEECRAAGIPVLLGPGMNIYRHAQCGRNFEYLGEDPFLAAEMVRSYVKGLQSKGVIATLKHFLANNTDYFRRRSDSLVDERAVREIYTPAFRAGIEAGARAVMTSYNLFAGEWCGQSREVIHGLLRSELGFQWLVMTDWWSVYDGVKVIQSGQDLEMPAHDATADARRLVEEGLVSEKDLDRMVLSQLATFHSMGSYDFRKDPECLEKFEDHGAVALQAAREGVVLLKNRDALLPLSSTLSRVLLTGSGLDAPVVGGGSAKVEGWGHVSLKDAMLKVWGGALCVVDHPDEAGLREADAVVFNVVTEDSEGWDRPFDLSPEVESAVRRAVRLNPRTVVLINSGSGIATSGWAGDAGAILFTWYHGQNGATAVAEILSGAVCPSGKLPVSIEKRFEDSPGSGYLPEGESLYTGWQDELEKTQPIHPLRYEEGIFVGYRWYEHKGIDVQFPFGHGLSFTEFEYSDLRLERGNEAHEVKLRVSVRNCGTCAGAEVVQVYVDDPESELERPKKELKGFQKVMLLPDERKTVDIVLERSAFAYWHPERHDWYVEPGLFRVLVGSSSADIRLEGTITLD